MGMQVRFTNKDCLQQFLEKTHLTNLKNQQKIFFIFVKEN